MPNLNQSKTGYYTFLAIFVLAIFSMGNWFERYQSLPLILAYGSSFAAYFFIVYKSENTQTLLTTGILVRVLLFLSLPILSDDLYRFIWDGTLLKNGIHPFAELPGFYLDKNIDGIDQQLYERLNSPNYFTIYPPLNQFIFWVSVRVGDGDWLVTANVIRLILLVADLGSLFMLQKLLIHYGKSANLAFWYFLNPLVILEFVGNLHFEGLVIFFLLAGIYGYEKNRNWLSASVFGLAIGTKLLPLIYLPYLFLKGLKERRWFISILAGIIGLLTFLPMLNIQFISGITGSLDLYFRSFEFNASIYFIAREIGFWIYGYNNIALIGPLLSILSFLSIIAISILGWVRKWSLPKSLLSILTVYLLFATTVHPWYILPLVAFGLLSGFWYPIVWSLLIFLTYIGYTQSGFELPAYILVIEYAIVLMILSVEIKNTPVVPKCRTISSGQSEKFSDKSPFEGG
ncbi:MAG: glycosyltransferase 87 family protein [Ekhidna sp.]|uniref:glycosyltransferase 87 family protein n=1 Tax=Ekhidna sp. TaxID=2608089 RepID=UPI0032EA92D1